MVNYFFFDFHINFHNQFGLFSGSYLLSGGHECVLVKWLYRKSEPTFRPRLGAPIIHLISSNDQTFYACTHSDNCMFQEFNSFFKLILF